MEQAIEALRREAADARRLAERSRGNANEFRARIDEEETAVRDFEALAQQCEAAIARLSPAPNSAVA